MAIIITAADHTFTLTTDAANVVANLDGKFPSDLGRPDLRAIFRTYTTDRSFKLDSTRLMRTLLQAVLDYTPEVEEVQEETTPETTPEESLESKAAALLAVVEAKVQERTTARKVSQAHMDRFAAMVALGDTQEDGSVVVLPTHMEEAGWTPVYRKPGKGWSTRYPGGKAAQESGWTVRTTSKGDLGFRIILTRAA